MEDVGKKLAEQKEGIKYGCHCELDIGQIPDDCVKDYDDDASCIYASRCETREHCKYWRPVTASAQPIVNEVATLRAQLAEREKEIAAWVDKWDKAHRLDCRKTTEIVDLRIRVDELEAALLDTLPLRATIARQSAALAGARKFINVLACNCEHECNLGEGRLNSCIYGKARAAVLAIDEAMTAYPLVPGKSE